MKTAKEMFEELGYGCSFVRLHQEVIRINYIIDYDYSSNVSFNIENKAFNVWFGKDNLSGGITVDMLKAINKQIEELGWDKEV